MKTNTKDRFLHKVIWLALFFIVLVPNYGLAADVVPSTLPAYCDPIPEDVDKLQDCVDYWGSNGQIGIYDDTPDPVNGPGAGSYGMAGAYNASSDTLLFVASTAYGTAIVGQLYTASTMQPQSGTFNIDQTSMFVGRPKAVYNSVNNSYFVVWQDERPATNRSSIYGRFINADGTMPANDFAVYTATNSSIGDLVIDYTNSRYVVGFDRAPDGPRIVTVSFDGTVGQAVSLDQTTRLYEGQTSVAYNSELNEYWYVYATTISGDDTAQEDDRIMFARVDAATMTKVGSPVQLSTTRIGRNAFSSPQIAYSPIDGAALVVWQEGGRTAGMNSEVYGRTIYNNLSLSSEHQILTGGSPAITSDFYGGFDTLSYNPATNSYALAVQDNNYATTVVQMDSTGFATQPREALTAQSQLGNFNPTTIAAGKKFVTPTSAGYSQTRITTVPSDFAGGASGTANAGASVEADYSIDSEKLSKAISQWYLYALGAGALLAVIMIIFGGYLVMSAQGNAAQSTRGKDFLYSSLVGLALLMAAFVLLNTINPELTQFKLPSSFKINTTSETPGP